MTEMEDTVKQLKMDEKELVNKLTRRKQELERVEKRLKGIENVKPEYRSDNGYNADLKCKVDESKAAAALTRVNQGITRRSIRRPAKLAFNIVS